MLISLSSDDTLFKLYKKYHELPHIVLPYELTQYVADCAVKLAKSFRDVSGIASISRQIRVLVLRAYFAQHGLRLYTITPIPPIGIRRYLVHVR